VGSPPKARYPIEILPLLGIKNELVKNRDCRYGKYIPNSMDSVRNESLGRKYEMRRRVAFETIYLQTKGKDQLYRPMSIKRAGLFSRE
jgi:hypothetical protein